MWCFAFALSVFQNPYVFVGWFHMAVLRVITKFGLCLHLELQHSTSRANAAKVYTRGGGICCGCRSSMLQNSYLQLVCCRFDLVHMVVNFGIPFSRVLHTGLYNAAQELRNERHDEAPSNCVYLLFDIERSCEKLRPRKRTNLRKKRSVMSM